MEFLAALPKSHSPESFLLQATPMTIMTIPRGESCSVSLVMEENVALVWQFHVKAFDIGFRVTVDGAASSAFTKRHDVAHGLVDGTLEGLTAGTCVVLHWDNSYSLLRGKDVGYRVMQVPPTTLHAAREAANEYDIKYNHPHYRPRAPSRLSRPPTPIAPPTDANAHNALVQALESAVVDTVAVFMAQPDAPLHAGSARALVLALEALLRHGVKTTMHDSTPEAPYFRFLVETRNVLRDDERVVADAELFTPPPFVRYLGWGRARAFLFYALNRRVLHRALDNLVKRRSIVERHYHTHALLAQYDIAKRAVAYLSALYGVTFDLTPLQDDLHTTVDTFPPTLYQTHALDAHVTGTAPFVDDAGDVAFFVGAANPDDFCTIQDCTPPRYLCLSAPLASLVVPYVVTRGGRATFPLAMTDDMKLVAVVQFQVAAHSLNVGVAAGPNGTLLAPLHPVKGSTDEWIECIVRLGYPIPDLHFVFDNGHSRLRTKAVQYRVDVTSVERYASAWAACADVAHVICWKQVIQRSLDWSAAAMEAIQSEERLLMLPPSTTNDVPPPSFTHSMSTWLGSVLRPSDASSCGQCREPFTLFRRCQECSLCAKGVCVVCSRHLWAGQPICDRCYLLELDKKLVAQNQPHAPTNPALDALRHNPTYDKYFKMLSFGVPPSAIGQKMQQDYIPQDMVDTFVFGLDGGSSSASRDASSSTRGRSASDGRPNLLRKKSNLRKLHWTALDTSKVSGTATIWTRETDKRKHAPIALSGADMDRVIACFGEEASTRRPTKKGGKVHSALDARRSNNINISLSRFKSLGGPDAVLAALAACDLDRLPLEVLQTLDEIRPTPTEMKRYSNFRGAVAKLDAAERFLVEMAKVFRVQEKIHVMLFVAQVPTLVAELTTRLRVLSVACHQILSSERLPRYFEIILALGNVLNEGTEHADATGVTLASLLKLSETRSIDQCMTLLQFLMQLIHERGEMDLFSIIDDLDMLDEAKRYSNILCASQFSHIQKQVAYLIHELKEEETNDRVLFDRGTALKRQGMQRTLPSVRPTGRGALLAAIREQPTNDGSIAGGGQSALLASIRQPKQAAAVDGQSEAANPRAALLAAIKKSKQTDEPATEASQGTRATAGVGRHALLIEIQSKGRATAPTEEASTTVNQDTTNLEQSAAPAGRRALLDAIRASQRNDTLSPQTTQPTENRATHGALMAAIRNDPASDVAPRDTMPPRNALLAAIQSRSSKTTAQPDDVETPVPAATSRPTYSKASNVFLTTMEAKLEQIRADVAHLQDNVASMEDTWHEVAIYLGESPAASSDYALGLLHRFLLDVKVAYHHLVARGVIPIALFSLAGVGDRIATVYGAASVLARRPAALDVAFPWAKLAFLTPDSVLRPGDRVLCRRYGRAILTSTRYAAGMVELRFAFGYAILHVDHVLRVDPDFEEVTLLQRNDPVLTPFGNGRVVRFHPTASVAVVQLITSTWSSPTVLSTSSSLPLAHVQLAHVHFAFNIRRELCPPINRLATHLN
ncbi:Aste57867_11504 [Aphanomyces stellatus]|uniref:Aste57867_11504 protein n=1 Tax=Aphanomyces stellatus TaxID=120398 RepID=A0A485KTG9_9STRA|nr:hypothetical protein As57867_011461 [Aphanomyces stellatus]VFT88365.1 Aste57867_11504 [Aphanomyces stellatus]